MTVMHTCSDIRAPMTSLIALTPTGLDVPVRRSKPKAATRSQSEPSQVEKTSPKRDQHVIPFDDWFIMPLYVCPTHATKDGLSESYRHKGSWTKPEAIRIEQKQMRASPTSKTMWPVPFTYIVTVNSVSHQFKCPWNEFRAFQKTLLGDETLSPLYSECVHSKYVEESFKGSVRRAVASLERMSEEVKTCLHAISQIPAIATQRAYQDLVGCSKNTLLHEELVAVLAKDHSHEHSPQKKAAAKPEHDSFDDDAASNATDTFDELQECLCDVYADAIAHFGEHVYARPQLRRATSSDEERDAKVEEVLCMDMLLNRTTLAFYTDCLFTIDKEQLTSSTGYSQCTVLGFGCRPLFTLKRATKTKWTLADAAHGSLLTLTLKRYGANQPMIVVARVVPGANGAGRAEEVVGMFRKSWRRGYQFILMSELVTQGKPTTAFAFANTVIHGQHRYLVGSVVSGQDTDLLVTATLSVADADFTKQRLHVTDGSDVLLQIALACSYDLLASARPFYRMDYHY
ncbi:hypothetical protein ACHHYP_01732 [Achlya hypogyna]|uniref:Uncharacterized protein n=1 Tax=Achlya hypogyna TaxID=1202772 RepID=A0A1V9ZT74_ACHHY|nr:hypothetical protein ACHHYP_01732 [Achlya hypogyna]